MPYRFRRSIRILPGLRLNIAKRGVSTSVGGRGAHVTIGHGEVRETVGLPGTGLSSTHVERARQAYHEARRAAQAPPAIEPLPKGVPWRGWLWIALIAAVFGCLALSAARADEAPLTPNQRGARDLVSWVMSLKGISENGWEGSGDDRQFSVVPVVPACPVGREHRYAFTARRIHSTRRAKAPENSRASSRGRSSIVLSGCRETCPQRFTRRTIWRGLAISYIRRWNGGLMSRARYSTRPRPRPVIGQDIITVAINRVDWWTHGPSPMS
jgi:hypothetical protein